MSNRKLHYDKGRLKDVNVQLAIKADVSNLWDPGPSFDQASRLHIMDEQVRMSLAKHAPRERSLAKKQWISEGTFGMIWS